MRRLGHYLLAEQIHETAHAVLYRGHPDGGSENVLVKVLVDEHPSPREIEKLRHEHAIVRQLPIAAVVQPVSLEEHGHGLVLVLADPGGRSLHQRLQQGKIDVMEALRIAAEIAQAIDAVHEHHIVHKDIQPANILVDPATLQVRLTGFGIATRLSHETQQLTSLGAMEGTLSYMSPEQTGRMNRALDRRTDVYSLGVVLYEMLTGEQPFAAADPMDLMHALLVRAPLPPQDRAPEIPAVVSDIVMKLLSKAPEGRYQRALGVAHDLRECIARLSAGGPIRPFPLGRHDPGNTLHIPQKLYGREQNVATLLDAFARARRGKAELLLVSGYAGIGKSLLVHEIHKEIARARGYFIAGKFEQLGRSVPYLPLAQAFNGLVHQLLAEREDVLARYRERIIEAVGAQGGVLTDLIPDLSRIIGPQPAAQALLGDAAQNRFAMVFQDFLRVFTTSDHPLVIFLDDLQWADLASLALLKLILSAPDRGALLVIGAYRSNEVDAAHPLLRTVNQLEASVTIHAIELGPLARADVGQFIAAALREEPSRIEPLSAIVFDKTHGNPFFLIQFLTALHKDGLLAFDADAGAWRFDTAEIQARMTTDNVSVFMAERIRKLAPDTQHALRLAACIGHRFQLKTLSIIRAAPRARVAAELWQALEEGVVVPLSADYRFFSTTAEDVPAEIDPSYRFSHDRVQQAAYSLIDDDQRAVVHLQIGRLMLGSQAQPPSAELFAVVPHLNLGASLITAPEERIALSQMNLSAGQKARASMAYAEAAGYVEMGASLLGDAGWEHTYDVCFALHREWAECAALAGALDKAELLAASLLSRARTALERAQVHELRSLLCVRQGRNADAIAESLAGLRLVGVPVHDTEEAWKAATQEELSLVEVSLKGRYAADLIDAPRTNDPEKELAMRLLLSLDAPAIGVMPELHLWSTVKPVSLSLTYGHAPTSARAYTMYGAQLAHSFRRHAEAYAFCKLGIAWQDKLGNAGEACMIHYTVGGVCHYAEHWRVALTYWERGYAAGLASGDFVFLSYTCSHTAIARIILGDPLHAVREQTDQFLALMKRTRIATSEAMLTVVRQLIRSLEGRTHDRRSMSDDDFDEAELAATLQAKGFQHAYAWYCTAKAILLYLHGDPEAAIPLLAQARERRTLNFTPEIRYYECLAILARGPVTDELKVTLQSSMEELAAWARDCSDNYLYELLLVQAENARVCGDGWKAMTLYDQAIAAAQKYDFPCGIALSNELAAKFHLQAGSITAARAHMTDAVYAYARWGAVAKVQRLRELYPALVPVEAMTPAHMARPPSGQAAMDLVDMDAFLRIQQALSSELVLEHVLEQLMRTVLSNAGAERGALVLLHGETLVIDAVATADPLKVVVGMGTPLEQSAELPVTIVHYAARMRELVVLGDASSESRFCNDPYVSARRPKSIACLAMTHQARVIGVMYLENNAAVDAFTRARIEVLRLLLSQAGISIENASLYSRLQAVTADLKRANEVLEGEVARRTEELHASNRRLADELAERQRVEQQRALLQEEVVRVQASRLAELSTPVIPVTEGILVMPLIGTVDHGRAAQLLEAALDAVHRRGTRIVIFDVTGMKEADADVMSALVRAAAALRMLGAEAVISGISPAVAQQLVTLSVSLSTIVTKATLEDGIGYALSQTGQRWVRGLNVQDRHP